MKKNRLFIYASVLLALGACTAEQIDGDFDLESPETLIDGDFDLESAETLVDTNSITCDNGLSAAFGYNAFILNDVTLQSGDTEGAIALGGDLTVDGAFTVATQTAGAFFDNEDELASSLVVNGAVIYASNEGINLNQGYIKIGDLTGTTIHDFDNNDVATNTRITPGEFGDTPRILSQRNQIAESVAVADVIDFETAFAELNAASLSFSELENNVIIEENNKITLAEDTINVLNLTGEELNNLVNFTFNNQPTVDSPLLINVDAAGEFVWTVQNQAGIGDEHGNFIVYNFFNSTQITIESGTTIIGSLFAPSSDVIKVSSDNINGQVIASSYIHMNGELHEHPYILCPAVEEEEVIETDEPVIIDEPIGDDIPEEIES